MNATTNDPTARPDTGTRSARASAAKASSSTATSLRDEFDALVADAQDLVNHTVDTMGTQTASARAKLQNTLANARDHITAGADSLANKSRRTASAADDYVREQPWQMIAVAAVAGIAVGVLLARR